MKPLKYTEAFNELQNMAAEIEQGIISIDELSDKVRRAAELIEICKLKLVTTEEDVNRIFKELENGYREGKMPANSSKT